MEVLAQAEGGKEMSKGWEDIFISGGFFCWSCKHVQSPGELRQSRGKSAREGETTYGRLMRFHLEGFSGGKLPKKDGRGQAKQS